MDNDVENRMVLEILLGLILIILLIILVFLFTNLSETKKTSLSNSNTITITNSFNTNTYNLRDKNYNGSLFNKKTNYLDYSNKNLLDYKTKSRHETVTGIFGNKINKYNVYVKNTSPKEKYFTVKFSLTNYDKIIFEISITHHIKSGEEKRFLYQDIESKYSNWDYKVLDRNV